jgi:hypothetical protein
MGKRIYLEEIERRIMARDWVDIGSAPSEEDCVQVEPTGAYLEPMRAECGRFLRLIRATLGDEPPGARLAIKSNPHDFGTYYEVVCYYDEGNEEAESYAWKCEEESPTRWPDTWRVTTCCHPRYDVNLNVIECGAPGVRHIGGGKWFCQREVDFYGDEIPEVSLEGIGVV